MIPPQLLISQSIFYSENLESLKLYVYDVYSSVSNVYSSLMLVHTL
jgi:hypothetical protein